MKFEKKCQFLEMQEHLIQRDNTRYYGVSLRVPGEGIFTVNIMGNRSDILPILEKCEFGTPLVVTFSLRAVEKGYRLGIDGLAPVKA